MEIPVRTGWILGITRWPGFLKALPERGIPGLQFVSATD